MPAWFGVVWNVARLGKRQARMAAKASLLTGKQ